MFEDIQFPVYRKYKNNKRFYKIMSPTEFEEIQLVGRKKLVNQYVATILPDRQFIYDLCYDTHFVLESTEEEYNQQYHA